MQPNKNIPTKIFILFNVLVVVAATKTLHELIYLLDTGWGQIQRQTNNEISVIGSRFCTIGTEPSKIKKYKYLA